MAQARQPTTVHGAEASGRVAGGGIKLLAVETSILFQQDQQALAKQGMKTSIALGPACLYRFVSCTKNQQWRAGP